MTAGSIFIGDLSLGRRSALQTLAGFASGVLAMVTPAAAKGGLDFTNPRDNLYAFGKIWGAYNRPRYSAFHGTMFARIGNKRLIPLFGYLGTGVIESKVDDKGDLWIRGKETGFFSDLKTGEILKTWDNPWTGERVEVFDFLNDNMRGHLTTHMPVFKMGGEGDKATLMNEGATVKSADGSIPFLLPFEQYGDDMMMAWDYTHEYTNPVDPARWPRASTGPRINPSEHFTFQVSRTELEDRSRDTVRYTAGFSRTAPWWPWMRMGGHELQDEMMFGRMFSHGGLNGFDDIPKGLLKHVEKHHPNFLEPARDWGNVPPKGTWEAYAESVKPEVQ